MLNVIRSLTKSFFTASDDVFIAPNKSRKPIDWFFEQTMIETTKQNKTKQKRCLRKIKFGIFSACTSSDTFFETFQKFDSRKSFLRAPLDNAFT